MQKSTEEVAEVNDREIKFYYLYDKHKRPRVTVALAQHNNKFYRGIALCSASDHVDQQLGEVKAKGRLKKALVQERCDLQINRDEAIRILYDTASMPFQFKSAVDVILTPQERILMGD